MYIHEIKNIKYSPLKKISNLKKILGLSIMSPPPYLKIKILNFNFLNK